MQPADGVAIRKTPLFYIYEKTRLLIRESYALHEKCVRYHGR